MWFEIHASLYARRVKGQMQVSLEWTKRETYRDFPTTVTVLLKQMDQSCPTKSVTRVNENAACFTTVNSFMMWPKRCPNFVSLRRLFHYSDCHYADFYCTSIRKHAKLRIHNVKGSYGRGNQKGKWRPPKYGSENQPAFGQFSSYKKDSYICINGNEFYVDWYHFYQLILVFIVSLLVHAGITDAHSYRPASK